MADSKRLSVKAILLGLLVDIGGSMTLGIVVGVVIAVVLISQGTPLDAMQQRADEFGGRVDVLLASMASGLLFTVLGGYVAGLLARGAELLNAGAVGAIGLVLATPFLLSHPLWYIIMVWVVSVPCAMLGGYLAMVTRKKPQPEPEW